MSMVPISTEEYERALGGGAHDAKMRYAKYHSAYDPVGSFTEEMFIYEETYRKTLEDIRNCDEHEMSCP